VLTSLAAYSSWESAQILAISERGVQFDPIQIRNIEGLGPVKADVNTSPLGSIDGETFVGAHTPKRNIVLTVGLNPDWDDWSMESLRRLLYTYFMPKRPIKLVFKSDDDFPDVTISGYTESVEPNIFAKDVEIQISILCPDPYFTAVEPTIVNGNVGGGIKTIVYNGTIETGYTVKVTQIVPPDAALITIRTGDPFTSEFFVTCTISATKYLLVNSIPGDKYVRNIELNTGIITNLLYQVSPGYVWPLLIPGPNKINILSNVPAIVAAYQISYFEKFGGL
jgi:hypothetical protein